MLAELSVVFPVNYYTANELPHPQVLLAFGFSKMKPLAFSPFSQSICMPERYRP